MRSYAWKVGVIVVSTRSLANVSVPGCSTLTSTGGLKTRHFGTIISELTSCLRIHTSCNSHLGGVSLEFTGELNDEGFSVTECTGGSMELSEEQLGLRYQVCGYDFLRISIPTLFSSPSVILGSISSNP